MYEGEENLKPEDLTGTPFAEDYARTAPNPEDWPVLIEKVKQLDREFRGWPAEAVRSIRVPTLVIIGDSDVVRPEHAVEIFRLLGGGVAGDLAGLPGLPARGAPRYDSCHARGPHRLAAFDGYGIPRRARAGGRGQPHGG